MPDNFAKTTRILNGVTIHEGMLYSRTDKYLKLDLFLPLKTQKAVPGVIVISGGGFRSQTGQRFRRFAEQLSEAGLATALIAYRGRPDVTYRGTIADTKAAVRFVRSISGAYNIDPDRIGAVGRSAGASLAALLAFTDDTDEFEGNGEHAEFSGCIQAAVGIAGTYDFIARYSAKEQIAIQPQLDAFRKSHGEWIGAPFSPTDEHWHQVSAINHVSPGGAPMLFIHTRDDPIVPWMQSRNMHAKMAEVGVRSALNIFENGGHETHPMAMELTLAFFREVL